MIDGLRINGINNGRHSITTPDFSVGGVAFFDGASSGSAADVEAAQWINAVRTRKQPTTLPQQAYTVTRILEGIYESAKSGKPFYFND